MDSTTLVLMTNRLLMAQGQVALLDKQIANVLTMLKECDKVSSITDAQEQEQVLAESWEVYSLGESSTESTL